MASGNGASVYIIGLEPFLIQTLMRLSKSEQRLDIEDPRRMSSIPILITTVAGSSNRLYSRYLAVSKILNPDLQRCM